MDDSDWYRLSVSTAMDFAKETIKGCTLINGGAAAGLVTFLPHAKSANLDIGSISSAILSFGLGTFFAVSAFGLSYLAQIYISETRSNPPSSTAVFKKLRYSAVGAIILSALAFVAGLLFAVGSLPD